jgi:hypothetical protein
MLMDVRSIAEICRAGSNSKFRNSEGMRYWFALTPALSQVWEREQETKLFALAPRGFSETRQGLGDEGKRAGMHSTGFEFGIAEGWVYAIDSVCTKDLIQTCPPQELTIDQLILGK